MSHYDRSNLLFCDLDLRASLDAQRRSIDREVQALDPNRVLNTAADDLVQYFVDKNHVDTPVLHRDQWTVEAKEETETRDDYGHRITVNVQRLYVDIPFDGERDLFRARASTFTMSPPRGRIGSQTLTLVFTPNQGGDPEALKASISREIDEIEKHLDWIRRDVEGHNNSLHAIAERAIEQRRARVLQQQGTVASLGIPLRERANAPQAYVAPAVRKKAVPTLPSASAAPFKPEPVLAMEHYEHVLGVIQSMTKVMERSPSTFARMDEESLRDQYLVQLNGHYQGSATGETFNAAGKTDILIREQDKNIFIGECKFWKGAKGYSDTVDQLLGYSSWRDTKTAVLVFNRNRDTSKVLEEVKKMTEAHPHYKRTLPWPNESGFRFVMHHPTDNNRELTMTVLVFDIPDKVPRPLAKKKA
jgi:hypothetical protein